MTRQDAPHDLAHPRAAHRSHLEKFLLGATVTAGIALGALGVTSSYQALLNKAAASPAAGGWGWGAHPWMLPIGVDVTILAFSLVHLLMIKTERPLAWVRWLPRLLAAVTIVLNWSSGVTFQGRLGHAVLVGVWIAFSEVVAHIYACHISKLTEQQKMERIRFVRWLYMPLSTARLYRLMRCWEITSYTEALERDRQRMVYRSGLRNEHGRRWRIKASEGQLQPLRLLKYGMTIEQALQEPDRQNDAQALRAQQRELRQAQARIHTVEVQTRVRAAHLHAEAITLRANADLHAARTQTEHAAAHDAHRLEGDLPPHRNPATAHLQPPAPAPQATTGDPEPARPAGLPATPTPTPIPAREPAREPDQHSRHHEPAWLPAGQPDHHRQHHATRHQQAIPPAEAEQTAATPVTRREINEADHDPGQPQPDTGPPHPPHATPQQTAARTPVDPAAAHTPGTTSRRHTDHTTAGGIAMPHSPATVPRTQAPKTNRSQTDTRHTIS